jgi:hypothetical protein
MSTIIEGDYIETKRLAATCKICGTPGVARFDSEYAALRDPLKLLLMFCCNECFDLRERRIKIETMLKRICHQLAFEKTDGAKPLDDKTRAALHDSISLYAKRFSIWCADMLRRPHSANAGYLVEAIIQKPSDWYSHLRDFETAVNQ